MSGVTVILLVLILSSGAFALAVTGLDRLMAGTGAARSVTGVSEQKSQEDVERKWTMADLAIMLLVLMLSVGTFGLVAGLDRLGQVGK